MTATIDEAAKTLGEFEALAQSTGEWDGADAVQFSDDMETWRPLWKGAEGEHPQYARARVHRKGVSHIDWQYVEWDESVPAAEDWRALWMLRPIKLFGSYALRNAYRHTFRDVVGDRRGPDEQLDGPTIGAPAANAAPRDWWAEYRDAETIEQLDEIRGALRAARQNTDALNDAYKLRKGELAIDAWAPAPGPSADAQGPATPERIAAIEENLARPERPAPQDHLPGNRAERRAASRKGRRR